MAALGLILDSSCQSWIAKLTGFEKMNNELLYRIIANSLPLARRPIIVSAINCMYGIASVTAPLMGGAFTTRLTWRLCFWINLPFGVVTMITIGLFVTATSRSRQTSAMTLKAKFGQLDVLGTSLFIPAIVCVLLVLQWGGSTYKWSDGRVVSLLVVSAVLLSIFIYVQHRKQEEATIPPRIMKQRSVASAAFFLFSMGGAFNILEYFVCLHPSTLLVMIIS